MEVESCAYAPSTPPGTQFCLRPARHPLTVPRRCRALRSLESTLLAWLIAPRRRQLPHPFFTHRRADLSSTRNSLPLHLLPSAIWLVLVASTRRLSTQRAGTRGFHFLQRHPAFTLHRHHTRARKHALACSSLTPPNTTTTTITTFEHPPPPALLLLTPPPLPLDNRCLALLEHCTTRHKSPPPHQHDTLPQLSAIIPRFLWQSPPLHVQVKTDRHSIQPAL